MTAPRRAVIDGTGADAIACERLLRAEGVAIDRSPDGVGDLVVVDCWTGELAPIVTRHRQAGAEITSIGDLLLTRTQARTVGVTGSGGKTTTTRLIAAMLAGSGKSVLTTSAARAGNAWPAVDLLDSLPHRQSDVLVVELTSTHLAYMGCSPNVAVVTSFWPDHVDLHGSLERYRNAKLTLLAHQRPDDVVVVNAADPGTATFATNARGRLLQASTSGPVRAGVGVDRGDVVATVGPTIALGRLCEVALPPPLDALALTAACAALAEGADPAVVAQVLRDPPVLQHRRRHLGTVSGVAIVDDSAATTPRKVLGALAGLDLARTIVIVGGASEIDGVPVLASVAEEHELAHAMRHVRNARAVVAFGASGHRVSDQPVRSITEACDRALGLARPGDTLVLAPMFPLLLGERQAFADALGVGDTPAPSE